MAALAVPYMTKASDWLQFGYDQNHSGNNSSQHTINQANVVKLSAVLNIELPAEDGVSAPVFLEKVPTSQGVKDLLFCGTFQGSIYALDAATGSVVWSHKPVSGAGTGYHPNSSTPAIDPNRLYVYYFALDGSVHKYEVANGNEVLTAPWPVIAR